MIGRDFPSQPLSAPAFFSKSLRLLKRFTRSRLALNHPPEPSASQGDGSSAVEVAIEEWLEEVKATSSPATVLNYRNYLRGYIKRIRARGHEVTEINHLYDLPRFAAALVSMSERSFSLKANTKIALLSFGRYLVTRRKVTDSAVGNIRQYDLGAPSVTRRPALRESQVPAMFASISALAKNPYDQACWAAICGMMVYAGLRVSEVRNLKVSNVHLDCDEIEVIDSKGNKDRLVGINKELKKLLLGYVEILERSHADSRLNKAYFFVQRSGRPWTGRYLAKIMQQISNHMNVDITCHGLRRTCATIAARNGRSVKYIQLMLGHSALKTTDIYLRSSEQDAADDMKDW